MLFDIKEWKIKNCMLDCAVSICVAVILNCKGSKGLCLGMQSEHTKVYMELMQYCSVNKGQRTATYTSKCITLGYVAVLLWFTLSCSRIFSEGTVSSPAHWISSLKFSPYVCKHGGFKSGLWKVLRTPKLSINLEEILLRAHWNFEEQNKVLDSSIIIINYRIIIIIIHAYCNYIANA